MPYEPRQWPPISATIRRARASTSICIKLLSSTVSLHWDLYTFHGGGQTAGIYANNAHGPTRAIQYKYLRRLSSLADDSRSFASIASPKLARISARSEEHTSELQSLMRISYAVFCLKKQTNNINPK